MFLVQWNSILESLYTAVLVYGPDEKVIADARELLSKGNLPVPVELAFIFSKCFKLDHF